MNRDTLLSLTASTQRRVTIIIGTFAIGVVTVLPLVDNYKDKLGECARLESTLQESMLDVANLENYQAQKHQVLATLETFQERVILREEATEFHQHIVDLAHHTDCRLKRISADEVLTRPWREGDNPLAFRQKRKNNSPTPYNLVRQKISLSVSGQPQDVKLFLQHLLQENKVSHATHFNLHPLNTERASVVLELEFWLISLEQAKGTFDLT